mmetsp:Transcript_20646/g.34012  ORF Transcript_20646/g.34012 Transcript_20646/m.34012 type:complete len:274 (+) Transcript_20646:65-886(+)|eukprot:CAMPEP_0184656810 /NCGR_PEP_ID=MMETSP0308-20130426/16772_1 /TAXON_ID=38269 /ORGANISM="Gloeochaete witrockiana, Strain SAG 46.84" /LENGTH=273 /DNA_ID=CAMNT_0027094097 /DNA_START=40 /DNA_END=861 /DNA_ORIENTATION=-
MAPLFATPFALTSVGQQIRSPSGASARCPVSARSRTATLQAARSFFGASIPLVSFECTSRHKTLVFSPVATATASAPESVKLTDLELLPYLDEEGIINLPDTTDARASVYAIYDADQTLVHVGMTRDIQESLRLHLGRKPLQCYFYRVVNFQKPSRTALDELAKKWIAESGSVPSGNDGGSEQASWEQPIHLKSHLTAEELSKYDDADEFGRKDLYRAAAVRVEKEVKKLFEERGVKEALRFDPNKKDKGQLDIKLLNQPNRAIPGGGKKKKE